jgi:hypothetical protein
MRAADPWDRSSGETATVRYETVRDAAVRGGVPLRLVLRFPGAEQVEQLPVPAELKGVRRNAVVQVEDQVTGRAANGDACRVGVLGGSGQPGGPRTAISWTWCRATPLAVCGVRVLPQPGMQPWSGPACRRAVGNSSVEAASQAGTASRSCGATASPWAGVLDVASGPAATVAAQRRRPSPMCCTRSDSVHPGQVGTGRSRMGAPAIAARKAVAR